MATKMGTPDQVSADGLRAAAADQAAAMIAFAQRAIRTPSPSGDERAVAELTADEMRSLGYDDVWTDRAGNVVGAIRGGASGPSVQFNAHLDHVSPGNERLWSRPPYGGVIDGGILYGRGASDVKGAMATQVHLAPVLRAAGRRPTGDVYVVGVVLEEVGGFGSRLLAEEMPTDLAVLAEATDNQLCRGHRGRTFLRVTFTGLSTHASAPERGRNPHFAAARFLLGVERLAMVSDPTFGGSSVAPTLSETDQTSGNVTPGSVSVYLDWRNVPGEDEAAILRKLAPLVGAAAGAVDGVTGELAAVGRPVTTYTGLSDTMPPTRGYAVGADDPAVVVARETLGAALGRPVTVGTWTFATDGGHLAHHGITTIGFAPGEERHAHTIHDQVSLAKMEEALLGNAALALGLTAMTDGGAP
jgi:putative selenium metabolism hydrolase